MERLDLKNILETITMCNPLVSENCYAFDEYPTGLYFDYNISISGLNTNAQPGDQLRFRLTIQATNQLGVIQLNDVSSLSPFTWGIIPSPGNNRYKANGVVGFAPNLNEYCFFNFVFVLERWNDTYSIWEDVISGNSNHQFEIPFFNCSCIDCEEDGENGGGEKRGLFDGQADINSNGPFSVGPNPFSNYLSINSNEFGKEVSKINILNIEGKKLLDINNPSLNNGKLKLDLSKLPKGIYFLNIYHKDGVDNVKIIKT